MLKSYKFALIGCVVATLTNASDEFKPTFGNVMLEFASRYSTLYYSAKANNWELAKYEIHEFIEVQEIAEAVRPKHKDQLKDFEHKHVLKLQKDIEKKDWDSFNQDFAQTTKACNKCHQENGYSYIHYKLPSHGVEFLKMELEK